MTIKQRASPCIAKPFLFFPLTYPWYVTRNGLSAQNVWRLFLNRLCTGKPHNGDCTMCWPNMADHSNVVTDWQWIFCI